MYNKYTVYLCALFFFFVCINLTININSNLSTKKKEQSYQPKIIVSQMFKILIVFLFCTHILLLSEICKQTSPHFQ